MKIETKAGRVKISCPAKLNLFLEVVRRRPDGFHDLDTVMETISIFDEVEIIQGGQGISIECDKPGVPLDETNTAWRAAQLMMDRCGERGGLQINIAKRIPTGGGLAGGSSNAAAVLLGLNALWGEPLGRGELMHLAAQIGSDVPFLVVGGTALCRGRGELVTELDGCGERCYLVVYPGIPVSTASVYGGLRMPLTDLPRDANIFVELLQSGDIGSVGRAFFNRLEGPAARLFPGLAAWRKAMENLDLHGIALSGSGSCYFGLCRDLREAGEKRAQLKETGDSEIFIAQTVGRASSET